MGTSNYDRVHQTKTCPECEGDGAISTNTSWIDDPQCEETHNCSACDGEGYIVIWTDPLADLKQARQHARASWGAHFYGKLRQRAVSPVCLPRDRVEAARRLAA